MNKKQIGIDAGVVWRVLDGATNRDCSYNELKRKTGLTDLALNRALGWLAREGKINIDDESEIISLPLINFF